MSLYRFVGHITDQNVYRQLFEIFNCIIFQYLVTVLYLLQKLVDTSVSFSVILSFLLLFYFFGKH